MESFNPCRWLSSRMCRVVVDYHVGHGPPPVHKKRSVISWLSTAGRHHRRNAAGRSQPLLKFLPEGGRPVLRADLQLSMCAYFKRRAAHGALIVHQLLHQAVEMHFDGALVQLVALQADALRRRGVIHLPVVVEPSEAVQRPGARPRQAAIRAELGGEVQTPLRGPMFSADIPGPPWPGRSAGA